MISVNKSSLPYRYCEQPSNPSSSSSHFSAAVSRSEKVVAKIHAPDLTRNLIIVKLLQEAAQCNGVLNNANQSFKMKRIN
ncbi:hypothetical protein DERP_005544 [Dermatophagoides pteronyssinus]|uniref:Uncharacterized protein n=1 Tax=Dermatophagoides pteronyssinus TaxID=6956 RepID=A0ABQ8JN29_DERPT|nr:hypothetical protein DERP_005544 [Dermatophagoides pteronyssinus]